MKNQIKKAAAWCFLLLFFVGCTQTGTPPDFDAAFSGKLTVENGTVSFSGDFSRQLIGCYTFTVTQPETFAGLTMESQNGKITLSFEGMEVTGEEELLPCSSFFGAVTAALDDIARKEDPDPSFQDEKAIVYSGTIEAGNYTIAYDGETKNPANLNIGGILAEFSDVTPYGATGQERHEHALQSR